MKVSSFNVYVTIGKGAINITDQIISINIVESLFGDLQGNIEIIDGVGLLENGITAQSKIVVEFEYIGTSISQEFYINGVSSVNMTDSLTKKTYTVNLKSINDMANSMGLIAKAFRGKSTEIIKKIHEEVFGVGTLNVMVDSITQGHYIAPNISPKKAIQQIKSQAYDRDISPFFLFQRLIDNKQSILNSLKRIEESEAVWTIQPSILNNENISKPYANVGQPESIIIHSDQENMDYKIGTGVYGKSVNNVDISNSELNKTPYGLYAGAVSVVHPIRMDMYTNDVKPLLNSNDYYNICTMQTILSTLFGTRVTAYHCNAIPGIGAGDKINLDLYKNKLNQGANAKYSGNYIIAKITHRVADGDYTQIIEMARS